jgi:hypothetical protein
LPAGDPGGTRNVIAFPLGCELADVDVDAMR